MEGYLPSLFDGVDAAELSAELARLERRRFARGEIVVAEGDRPRQMYVVAAGRADIFMRDRDGQEHAVNAAAAGSVVGEMSLVTGQAASATVRVTEDLEVWVVREADFHRLAHAYPQLYRNLVAILADRLIRSNHRALPRGLGRATVLLDHGAPPWLGYALACSTAWHTRRRTLLLALHGGNPAPALAALADTCAAPPLTAGHEPAAADWPAGRARAEIMLRPATGRFGSAELPRTVDELRHRYEYVLIQVAGPTAPPGLELRAVRLVDGQTRLPETGDARPGHTLRAVESGYGADRPTLDGRLDIPRLLPADEAALIEGRLPPATPAGAALGWAARDLAGLKVGLALGAGSMKGYAHIGVLRVLARLGLQVDYLTGASIGSAVAALYAMGQAPDEIATTLDRVGRNMVRPTIPFDALLSNRRLRHRLRQVAGDRRLEELSLPVAIVAADLVTGREVVFRRGPVWSAVLASVSIPGVFAPQRVGPYRLVDGGIVNPVPSDVAAALGADIVIAVRLAVRPAPLDAAAPAAPPPAGSRSVVRTIMRSIDVMQSKMSAEAAEPATILIEPSFETRPGYGLRDLSQGRPFIAIGEAAAEASLPRLTAALPWLRG